MRISDWSSDVCSSDLAGVWGAVAVHRLALLRSEARPGGGRVERLEQSAVGDAGGDREVVGERHRGNDGIEETRVALRGEVLLDGAAGAALAHHVRDRKSKRLNSSP